MARKCHIFDVRGVFDVSEQAVQCFLERNQVSFFDHFLETRAKLLKVDHLILGIALRICVVSEQQVVDFLDSSVPALPLPGPETFFKRKLEVPI